MKNVLSDKTPNADAADLHDSKKDQEKLKPEVVIIDMPEVQDIPGQENVRVPDMREMQDTTISSADEEAEDLLSEINTGPGNVNEKNKEININDRDYNDDIALQEEQSVRKQEEQGDGK
jgi:hypothetical protein